jgi:hypothetical protein
VILPSAKAALEPAPMISGLMKEITRRFFDRNGCFYSPI